MPLLRNPLRAYRAWKPARLLANKDQARAVIGSDDFTHSLLCRNLCRNSTDSQTGMYEGT